MFFTGRSVDTLYVAFSRTTKYRLQGNITVRVRPKMSCNNKKYENKDFVHYHWGYDVIDKINSNLSKEAAYVTEEVNYVVF